LHFEVIFPMDDEAVVGNSRRKRRPAAVARGTGKQAQHVLDRLSGFDPENCLAFREIRRIFSVGITHNELESMARIMCVHCPQLVLDRDAKRDNRVLIKWYSENWDIIMRLLPQIRLRDANEAIIDSTGDLRV
jgi:hypothetical protein